MYDKQLDSGRGTLLHLCDDVIQQEVSFKLDVFFLLTVDHVNFFMTTNIFFLLNGLYDECMVVVSKASGVAIQMLLTSQIHMWISLLKRCGFFSFSFFPFPWIGDSYGNQYYFYVFQIIILLLQILSCWNYTTHFTCDECVNWCQMLHDNATQIDAIVSWDLLRV